MTMSNQNVSNQKVSTQTKLKSAFDIKALAMGTALSLMLTTPAFAAADQDKDGIPDTAEALIHTDPAIADTDGDGTNDLNDKTPVFSEIEPQTAGNGKVSIKIKEALVEDNYDYALRKDATDHLELLLKNTGKQTLSGMNVDYQIKNLATNEMERYHVQLGKFTLAPGEEQRVHFDDGVKPGHFRANPNSMYKTNTDEKQFTVWISASGYQPVTTNIHKDAGGAEQAD